MRLIDADKLRKDVIDLPDCYNGFSDTYDKARILDLVDEQPTVDAVPVVRCKSCRHKYYDGNQIICQKLYWCDGNNFEPSAEDFCSQG